MYFFLAINVFLTCQFFIYFIVLHVCCNKVFRERQHPSAPRWKLNGTICAVIGTLTKVFCIFGPNLVILAWTGPELSRWQASDRQTDRQTDRQMDGQTDRQADRQKGRQADRQTGRQTERQAGRQTDRQTDRQTETQTETQTQATKIPEGQNWPWVKIIS